MGGHHAVARGGRTSVLVTTAADVKSHVPLTAMRSWTARLGEVNLLGLLDGIPAPMTFVRDSYSRDQGPVFRQYELVSGGGNVGDRFRDPLVWVERFTDEVLVRCPGCGECAVVFGHLGTPEYQASRGGRCLVARQRLRCLTCSLFKDGFPSERVIGEPVDPYFRLPLWLQANCCGKLLWAYNAEHLDLLESYVGARLRERRATPGSMSMLARLPAWLKSAKNRDTILRATWQLRSTLPTAGQ